MKATHFLFVLAAISLTACSTTNPAHPGSSKADPETVLVTYHVKPGNEGKFQEVLSRAWQVYRREHLVFVEPHIVVRDTENGDKNRFVEIFTWVNRAIPEHAPDAVKTIWEQEQSLCEARSERGSIAISEVELLLPCNK
jgi:hypothetical protein